MLALPLVGFELGLGVLAGMVVGSAGGGWHFGRGGVVRESSSQEHSSCRRSRSRKSSRRLSKTKTKSVCFAW